MIVDFDPADEGAEPVLSGPGVAGFEFLADHTSERGDLCRRDRGPGGRIRGDLIERCLRQITLALQPRKTLLELVVEFDNTLFNGQVEPADALAQGFDLGLQLVPARGDGMILGSRSVDERAEDFFDPLWYQDPVGYALEHQGVELCHR